jgi:hypothetical protein
VKIWPPLATPVKEKKQEKAAKLLISLRHLKTKKKKVFREEKIFTAAAAEAAKAPSSYISSERCGHHCQL